MALVLALCLALLDTWAASAAPNRVGYPNSMASAGDSITRAYNTGFWPFTDSPSRSWSTGSKAAIGSQYRRILAEEPAILGRNHNLAVSGAKVVDLLDQARAAVGRNVAYVTILIGANDLCTRNVADMTPVSTFRDRFEAAVAELAAGSPRARIYVVSIPKVYRLWRLFKDNLLARTVWRTLGVCRSLLARPRSDDPADVERRLAVKERNVAYNRVLTDVCLEFIHCRSDGNAVFRARFTSDEVSHRDYFHPSRSGQARLARVSWRATFDFTDETPPTSVAETAAVPTGTYVVLTATDDEGVAGIEFRLDRGPWQRYTSPLVLAPGSELRFRAVDVNGNIEWTNVLLV